MATKAYEGGIWGIVPLILNLGARWRCVVNITVWPLYLPLAVTNGTP